MLKKILRLVLFLITGLQIGMGLVWMVLNFGEIPQFALSAELLEVSRTWILDEYIGCFYPAVIGVCHFFEGIFRVPFQGCLYALQIAAAFGSGVFLLSTFANGNRKRLEIVWGSLYLMTIPLLMQLHLSILPYSFALSLTFVWLGSLGRLLKKQEEPETKKTAFRKNLYGGIGTSITGIILILLLPETVFMVALAGMAAVGITLCRKEKKKAGILALTMFLAFSIGIAGNALSQEPGSRGKIQKSVASAVMSRVVWPYFEMNYYFWPPEVKEVMNMEMAREIAGKVEQVSEWFGPAIEETYGRAKARELYWQMAKASFNVRTKEVCERILQDFGAYLCPQISVNLQLHGVGTGLNAYNYKQMQWKTPKLTKYYVRYSLNSFVWAFVLGSYCIFENRKYRKRKKIEEKQKQILPLLLTLASLWQLGYAVLTGGGMAEYKNAWLITAFYGLWILAGFHASKGVEGDYNGQDSGIDTLL